MKRASIVVLIALALWTTAKQVQAEDYGVHHGLPWFGYGFSGSLYGLGRVPVPPYYALHPPVYYSHPTARPYGQSPYAWRDGPEDLPAAKPQLTINPYYQPDATDEVPADSSQTAGLILNPFFVGHQRLADQ